MATNPGSIFHRLLSLFIRIILYGFGIFFCWWTYSQEFSSFVNLLILIGGMLFVFPIVWIGRIILDRQPTIDRAKWTTVLVHFGMLVPLGVVPIKAVQTAQSWAGWTIPIPLLIGEILVIITAILVMLTIINMAVKGLGAPFAIALTRKLNTDWIYAWNRNPMVLTFFAFMLSLGIWFQSVNFLLWVIILVIPTWIFFLKVYEERELEIRFGASYLAYKSRTPFLFPRKPRSL